MKNTIASCTILLFGLCITGFQLTPDYVSTGDNATPIRVR
jgi:hypothetical protein